MSETTCFSVKKRMTSRTTDILTNSFDPIRASRGVIAPSSLSGWSLASLEILLCHTLYMFLNSLRKRAEFGIRNVVVWVTFIGWNQKNKHSSSGKKTRGINILLIQHPTDISNCHSCISLDDGAPGGLAGDDDELIHPGTCCRLVFA